MRIVPGQSGGKQRYEIADHSSFREYQALVALIQRNFSAKITKSVDGPDASVSQLKWAKGSVLVLWDDVGGLEIGLDSSSDNTAAEEVAGFLAATDFPST